MKAGLKVYKNAVFAKAGKQNGFRVPYEIERE